VGVEGDERIGTDVGIDYLGHETLRRLAIHGGPSPLDDDLQRRE